MHFIRSYNCLGWKGPYRSSLRGSNPLPWAGKPPMLDAPPKHPFWRENTANGTRVLPHAAPTGPLSGLGGVKPLAQPQLPTHSWARHLHDLLVPAGSPEGQEGEAAGGSVVEGDPDAPEVHGDPKGLLLGLAQHGPLVDIGVLGGDRERGRNQHQNMDRGAPKNYHQNTARGAHQKSSPEHGSGCSQKIITRTWIRVLTTNHHPKQSSDPSQNRAQGAHQKSSAGKELCVLPKIITWNSSGSSPKVTTQNRILCPPKNHPL